jgi:hypothetical protein
MTKTLNCRQARWVEKLSPFDFKIIYRKELENGKADMLSRRLEYHLGEGGSDIQQPVQHFFKPGPLWLRESPPQEAAIISSVTLKTKT